jgi:hypothetical protein
MINYGGQAMREWNTCSTAANLPDLRPAGVRIQRDLSCFAPAGVVASEYSSLSDASLSATDRSGSLY